jgi:CelD/BcsL family acetyltransferase involved in cellulose biosynthesis
MITVDRHPSTAPLAAEWDALADRAGATPFLRPAWTAAWAAAFAGGRVEVLTARRDGRLCGVLPIVRRAGVVRSAANAHTPDGDVLAEDDATVRTLVTALYAARPRAVALTHLAAGGGSQTAARSVARGAGYRIAERTMLRAPYLDVEGTLEDYLRAHRRVVADLRRRRRRLEERGGVVLGADGTLQELLLLEAAGWKGAGRTAITARPSTQRFYTEVAGWAASTGTLRIFVLRLDGRPLGALLCLEEHGVLHFLKGGFDPAFARFSPGQTVLAEAIAHAFRCGLRRVEMGGGAHAYKLCWTRTVHERVAVRAYAPGPVGALAWAAEAHGRPLAQRAGLDRLLRPGRDRLLALYDRARNRVRARVG